MKTVLKKSVVLIMVFAMAFSTTVAVSAATTKTKTIYLKKKTTTVSASMKAGEKLKLTFKDGKKTIKTSKVKFKSSRASVAAVSSKGVVTARKAGKATITMKANGKVAKLRVTVKKKEVTPTPPTPTPDPGPVGKLIPNLTFMSTYEGNAAPISIRWDVQELNYANPNDKPNLNLTIAALLLATNAETTHEGHAQWDQVGETLAKLGFENFEHGYFDGDDPAQDVNYPAMAFAMHPEKVNGKTVVAAVFRGSSSFQDFITDALSQIDKYIHPQEQDPAKTIGGFYEVGVNATNELQKYLEKHNLKKEETTLFITGHSLGAATASLVGLRSAGTLANPDSVFCYPFATPNYFKGIEADLASERMTGKDMKLFSFDNEEDIVPDVPLGLSYYKAQKRVNFDREAIQKDNPEQYELFNTLYTYFRGRSYEEDNSNFMPKEYSFKFFSDKEISVDSIMVRNHMPYTYMALILSELPAEQALSYIGR